MMITKPRGQICKKCGEFSKKFIICEVCKKKVCLRCASDENFCIEHYIKEKRPVIIEEYFMEKYKVPI